MQNQLTKILAGSLLATTLMTSAAFAQYVPDHPRVNEVDQRLANEQHRINNNVRAGDLTPRQAMNDERREDRVQRQLSVDEARHGGHITPAEQRRLNFELNRNSNDIYRQHEAAVYR